MSASKARSALPGEATAMRERACASREERTASAETGSYTIALASASLRQKSSSSAVERQFSGVIMMPASWQAQCSVAASQRFCSTVTRWSPLRSPSRSKPATSAEMRLYQFA
jgi:hypothetical protein